MLKSYGVVVGGWVAWSILVSAPVPFVFKSYLDLVGVGLGVLGLRVWGQGLTIGRFTHVFPVKCISCLLSLTKYEFYLYCMIYITPTIYPAAFIIQ